MIIVRSPLRITLGGGGTDVPAYYQKHGGFCVSAAIDKYVYVSLHETFEQEIILKYSKLEHVKSISDVQHPIIREALRLVNITDLHLEITSHADIPAGTGLGSSSSFTAALLQALFVYLDIYTSPNGLAAHACEIEIERLNEPIGKQDQYISAHGGLNAFTFCPDGTVEVEKFPEDDFVGELESSLLLFFTSHTRSAGAALKAQTVDNLDKVLASGYASAAAIRRGDKWALCDELNKQWDLKLERSPYLDPKIVEWRNLGIDNGATAGKLVGAGAGGFLMFYAWDKQALRSAMFGAGLKEVRFCLDLEGTKVITQ